MAGMGAVMGVVVLNREWERVRRGCLRAPGVWVVGLCQRASRRCETLPLPCRAPEVFPSSVVIVLSVFCRAH